MTDAKCGRRRNVNWRMLLHLVLFIHLCRKPTKIEALLVWVRATTGDIITSCEKFVCTCFEMFVDGTMKLAEESMRQRVNGLVSSSWDLPTSRTGAAAAADDTVVRMSCWRRITETQAETPHAIKVAQPLSQRWWRRWNAALRWNRRRHFSRDRK